MAKKKSKQSKNAKKQVATLTHDQATRRNIPTAEHQAVMDHEQQAPVPVAYPRHAPEELKEEIQGRDRDLDPQLVWRGKDEQEWSDLVVQAPPLFIQEKVHPKVLVDELRRQGNLFVIFGEPDIEILPPEDAPEDADPADYDAIRVRLRGVDVFRPQSGEVESGGPEDIACWFIDSDYNEESFFVRHAYFLGANDPYKSLKTTLKAEINADAWESLHSDTSREFRKPQEGRIAVKVINHLGDEVMKVFPIQKA